MSNADPPPGVQWGGPSTGEPESAPLADAPPPKPSAWPILGWILAALVAYFVVAIIAAALTREDTSSNALLVRLILGGIAATLVGFVAVPAIALRHRQIHPPSWQRPRMGDLGWAALVLVASYATLLIYTVIVETIGADNLLPESTIEDDDFRQSVLITAITGLLVIGVAPFAEEFIFRRFILGGLRLAWGAVPALLVSAALFSVLHADLGSMIPFAVIGLIFGYAYLRTGSLTAPTIAHLVFNIIGFTVTTAGQGIG